MARFAFVPDLPAKGYQRSSPDPRPLFDLGGWRWMTYDELREISATARRSYVVRPYYRHSGEISGVLTPEGGDLSLATAHMHRVVPFPRALLPYPVHSSRNTRGLIMAVNNRLPAMVPRFRTGGTAAIIDGSRPLPGIDLLPEPMRWETPLRVDHYRLLPGLPRSFGRPRNLPSGAPLRPVPLPEQERRYFAPLAVDPAAAASVLSPQLLALTRRLGVAWWCEGSMLFVWRHDTLPLPERELLAGQARQIHQLLTG